MNQFEKLLSSLEKEQDPEESQLMDLFIKEHANKYHLLSFNYDAPFDQSTDTNGHNNELYFRMANALCARMMQEDKY